MNCINFRIRKHKKIPYFYCTSLCSKIDKEQCKGCKDKAYKEYKPMKQSTPMKKCTYKHAKAEKDRFSVFTNDLTKCIEDKDHTGHIDTHECLYGSNRQNSIKYGICIPLCRTCHQDPIILLKWQIKGQEWFVIEYGYDKFMEIFKINYVAKKEHKKKD